MSIVKIPEHQLDLTNTTARIDTAQNDLADLGDQVSNIESKIPNDASETNPLATKGQVEAVSSDLTDLENKTEEIESKIPETATSTNKLVEAEFLASELAKKQDTGDYATKTDVNSLADDLATVTNQVGEQEEAINGLNSAVTNLSNNKADKADSLFGYGITDAYTKEEVNGLVSSAFHYKGSKASVLELPTEGNIIGDVWNVLDTGANYAWTGTEWDKLSETVDLSGYYTKDEVNNNFSTKSDVNAHITNTNNPHNVTKSQIGLGNVDNTADADKPISTLQQSALDLKADKSDTYTKTEVDTELAKKANSADLGTMASKNASDYSTTVQANSLYAAKGLENTVSTLSTTVAEKANTADLATVAISGSYNDLTNKPTIPSAVTETTVSGWGFTKNAGTITGIKMNGASKGTSGVIDLGTVLTAHQDISGKANIADLAAVATSGSYNDLRNKPTIPDTSNLATKAELANYIPISQKGTASGVATLGTDGKVPTAQLPEIGGSGFDFEAQVAEFQQGLNSKVSKSGDTMTGALNVPTAAESENSTVVANTAWVRSLLNGVPTTEWVRNLLNEEMSKMLGRMNFNARVDFSISHGQSYIVPSKGYLWINSIGGSSQGGKAYINGGFFAEGKSSDSLGSAYVRAFVPVSAGDVLSAVAESKSTVIVYGFFVPQI